MPRDAGSPRGLLRWAPLGLLLVAATVALNLSSYHRADTPLLPEPALVAAAQAQPRAAEQAESLAAQPSSLEQCHVAPHTELAGEVVQWGDGHVTSSWEACCAACEARNDSARPCNVWVFCPPGAGCEGPKAGTCWLKHQRLMAGMGVAAMKSGGDVPWTSGWLSRYAPVPDAKSLGLELRWLDPASAVGSPARPRECGSPATDGYAHVNASCLEASVTARQFNASEAARLAQVVWAERNASYDGLAVAWGIGNKHASAEACAEACRRHVPDLPGQPVRHGGQFGKLPCNAWVFCPVGNALCFEPDAHTHTGGDCWLKYTEVPEAIEVNSRGGMCCDPATFRQNLSYSQRHRQFPGHVPWTSGVLLPPGVSPSNGTWGARATW